MLMLDPQGWQNFGTGKPDGPMDHTLKDCEALNASRSARLSPVHVSSTCFNPKP